MSRKYLDPNIRLSRNFTLAEFLRSETADQHGIEIRVAPDSREHRAIVGLVDNILQPLRTRIARPVKITSGLRPIEVNRLVGGVDDSEHVTGNAGDIQIPGFSPLEVCELIVELQLPYNQLIHEFGWWVHVSHNVQHKRERFTAWKHPQHGTTYTPGLHSIHSLEQQA